MIHLSFNLVHVSTYGLILAAFLYGAMIVYAKLSSGGLESLAGMALFAYSAYVIGVLSIVGLVVAALISGWST